MQNLQKDDWDVSILIKPSQAFDAALGMASQHELPAFVFPPHTDSISYYLPPPLFRIFLGEEEEQAGSLPDPYSIAHFIVHDNLTDVLCLFEINRKECAKYLFMVQYSYVIGTFADSSLAAAPKPEDMETDTPAGPSWSVDQLLAEVIFTEMFRLPKPEFKTVYYASLLVEVCKSFPDSFPTALAKAISKLYERLPSMDIECAHRFWTWLSHHLSNFGYLWNWAEWYDCTARRISCLSLIYIRSRELRTNMSIPVVFILGLMLWRHLPTILRLCSFVRHWRKPSAFLTMSVLRKPSPRTFTSLCQKRHLDQHGSSSHQVWENLFQTFFTLRERRMTSFLVWCGCANIMFFVLL